MGNARTSLRRHTQNGFTLIELMVVLLIIGVLAALIVPNVLVLQALKLYRLDNGRYPSSEQGLSSLVAKPTTEPIPVNWRKNLDQLPNDPWGKPYVYLNPGIQGEVDVMSLGADGQAGGEGKNADIGSWQP
jgi:general secretion pathway protein G